MHMIAAFILILVVIGIFKELFRFRPHPRQPKISLWDNLKRASDARKRHG